MNCINKKIWIIIATFNLVFAYISVKFGAIIFLFTLTGFPIFKTAAYILVIICVFIFAFVNYFLLKKLGKHSTERAVLNSIGAMFLSFIIVFMVLIVKNTIITKRDEANKVNQYPALVEINKNLVSLRDDFTFRLEASVERQYYTKYSRNLTYVAFDKKGGSISSDDIAYLTSWLNNIMRTPYYLEIEDHLHNTNLKIESNGQQDVSYCIPKDNIVCKEMVKTRWQPVISYIKELTMTNATLRSFYFLDTNSNEESEGNITNLYFEKDKLNQIEINIFIDYIRDAILKKNEFLETSFIFSFVESVTNKQLIFETKFSRDKHFELEDAKIITCELTELCHKK